MFTLMDSALLVKPEDVLALLAWDGRKEEEGGRKGKEGKRMNLIKQPITMCVWMCVCV